MPTLRPTPGHPISLRPAKLTDVVAIAALEKISFHGSNLAFSPRQIRYLIQRAQALVLVATAGPQILGWITALCRQRANRRWGRIYTVAVDPNAQGQGIGRRLIEKTLANLSRKGIQRIFLEVDHANQPAIALYQKLGFTQIHKLNHYYGRHRHALHMLRQT